MKGIDPWRLALAWPALSLAAGLAMADTPALVPPVGAGQSVPDGPSAPALAAAAQPSVADGQRVWSQAPTVQDLVRLDLEAAMAQRRGQPPAGGAVPGSAPVTGKPEPAPLRLTAIYGVGRQLQAELLSEGRRVVLRAGGTGAVEGLRLIAIEGECVRVRARDEAVRSVCLARPEAS